MAPVVHLEAFDIDDWLLVIEVFDPCIRFLR
jgi:hypothetical protein